ncbi:MAG: hypothetical protein DRN33_05140 [Thermoplasmata archaeon]|jgi:SepF-like predicted cell division protein (DUF552 family)|nr:MAG: DUF552 domain-containing protein [Thermoplasmata archaeon]RLF62838.1 MAG: hypothetical protein DRN33_05140 [Thermoplasmata archaeon]
MAIIGGIFDRTRRRDGEYIDLAEQVMEAEGEEAMMHIKVAELQNYEDMREFTDYVYKGDILILDTAPISSDDLELERITNELKRVVSDIGGDIAGLGRNLLIVTPAGIKIDRRKIRGSF